MRRNTMGRLLALVGVLCILTETGLHWVITVRGGTYPIGVWPVLIGATIGFVGFYIQNPSDAEDGGSFIVNSGLRIVQVLRTGTFSGDVQVSNARIGRRKTDATLAVAVSAKSGETVADKVVENAKDSGAADAGGAR